MRPDLSALVDTLEGGINELRQQCRSGGPLVPTERLSAAAAISQASTGVANLRKVINAYEARRAEELGQRAEVRLGVA